MTSQKNPVSFGDKSQVGQTPPLPPLEFGCQNFGKFVNVWTPLSLPCSWDKSGRNKKKNPQKSLFKVILG